MPITLTPTYRAMAIGGTAAAILIGAFALGITTGNSAPSSAGQHPSGTQADAAVFSSAGPGRITVTGTGTVTGTPNQLILSMGVQVNAGSVGSALGQADQVVNRVTATLRARGVTPADIQTSGLYIQPNYRNNSQIPDSYGVDESITATLRRISAAGAQIDAAVQAGGNAVTVDGISLNLTDTSSLLGRARAAAVADARHKASQYAAALGRPLGPVVSITDQAPTQPILPYANGAAGASRAPSVPISPGTQQLSVSVTVVYAIG
jgi:uncharacterized protein YggE